ncbi:Origin recognition complex subunit 5 [Hondaea fermentalgiana]|uniref:Origin recognition complex subunit 5 n=1 Tax=Hondaea fermentalgiana TaxID=2315210 RepID=A0A2R5GF74_9STRA|nr:Origin recognition complex subunit 5 [Hondaea fermentalgiana]|eukprot:GBG29580.1 Origin recognition complex subunit 5 [Hondaea fermentalgiana]
MMTMSDADSDDDDEEEEEEGDEEEDEAESENERVSFAQLSRKELWPRLREEGWHYKVGRGLVSHYYLAPNVATVEDGILGETVFESEDALYNHFQNLREPRKASAAATSPGSQSVLEMWSAMMGRGWRQVDNLFISPDAKPVREGPRDLAVFKEDHCTVFRSMRRAVSNFIMKNKSSPTSSQRETLGGEGASHNDNDNSDGEDRGNSDSEDDEEENEKADALRKFNEYMQTLRDEQPRPANFFRDFFPMLREAGWTYKYGSGIDTEIFLAPGIKRISDGVRGETVIPSQASMCEWIKLNRGAIQQSLHRALLTTPSEEKVTSSDGALSGVDPGRARDTFGDKGAESSSEAGDVEAMELASAAGESDVDVDAAAPERSGVNETQDGTDGDDAIRPRLCDDENKVMKAPRYEHPSGSHLHDEFEEVLAATSELKLRWPGREEQIDVLAGIMTPRHLLTSHLVLHGDTATGKSGVIRALLNALKYPFAAVDCEECYTPTILFQRLISQMPAPIETGDAGNFMDLADTEAENADEGGDEHDADDADAEDSYIARKNRNVAENRAVLESLGIVLSPESQSAQGRQTSFDSENVVPTTMDIAGNEVVPETGEASVVSVGGSAIPEARKRWQLAPERCGSMREFMLEISRRFRPSREAKETFYLLLENVSRLEDLGPKFLPALLRIERTTGCNICVVLTTSELPGPMSLALRNASTCFVEFPAYSQMEQRKILMMQLGARAGKAYSEGDVRSFVAVALQTFSSQVRDLREMSRICSDLWEALVKRPGSLGNPQTAFRVALEGRVGLTFKMLYHHDFELDPRAENPNGHTLERWERDEIKRAADLPYDSKVVLLASFLGSYNSPEHDRTLFGHARKLSKQQKYGSAATSRKLAGASAGQLLLGPKVFNLERLVNLYRALEGMLEASASRPGDEAQGAPGKRRPTRQLNKQVASLISAGLLTRVSRAEDLDLVKLKCTVPFDFAQALAETVKLDLAELLEA